MKPAFRALGLCSACCAGGPGSIPAIGLVELQYSDDFSPSRSKVVGYGTRLDNWRDLAFPECREEKNPSGAIYGRT